MYKYDTIFTILPLVFPVVCIIHIVYYYNIDQAAPVREYKICYTNDADYCSYA